MSAAPQGKKSASVTINPQHQNVENVHRIVDQILNLAGCGHCGRLAFLNIDFIVDPPPELGKEGAISFEKQGF